jgi:hypothetical protein
MRQLGGSRLAIAIGVTVALVGLLVLAAGVLAALPALLAFVPLLAGRYLAIERLEQLIEARRARRGRPQELRSWQPRARLGALVPRGGQLLGSSLAKRPPPVSIPV